jgi:hypothetical protein
MLRAGDRKRQPARNRRHYYPRAICSPRASAVCRAGTVAACRLLLAEPLPAVAGFAAAEEAAVAVVQDARSPAPEPPDAAAAEEVGAAAPGAPSLVPVAAADGKPVVAVVGAAAPGALSQVPVLLPAVAVPDAPWSALARTSSSAAAEEVVATVSPCSAAADR